MDLINIEEIDQAKPVEEKEIIIDFQQLHDSYLVNLDEHIPQQPIALSIGESQYGNKYYPNAIASYGDFSCIVGESKAKKSFFKSLLVARYIGGNSHDFAPDIKSYFNQGKFVIDIDTEQSAYHSQRAFRRVGEMEGTKSPYYKPFRLRTLSPKDRLNFIDWIFTQSNYKNHIGLLVIDGVADLIHDINDIQESTMIVQKLMTWSEKSNCHIITILHLNPGTDKPKGHLGTFVMQKAESIMRVKKEDPDTSIVTADYARNKAFDPFLFEIKNGLPFCKSEFAKISINAPSIEPDF